MKQIICYGTGVVLLVFASACGSRQGSKDSYQTNPGTDSSILIEQSIDSASGYMLPDTIALTMEESGDVYWAADSQHITLSKLQQEVQDSLLSIYLLAGRLPAYLDIQYKGTVTMGIRGTADDQVRQAQEVVRNAIATKQLNTSFGRLNPANQKRFRDSFPVLFQPYY